MAGLGGNPGMVNQRSDVFLRVLHLVKRYLFARWISYRLGLNCQVLRTIERKEQELPLRVNDKPADLSYYSKPQVDVFARYGVDNQFSVILPGSVIQWYAPSIHKQLDLYYWLEYPRLQRIVNGKVVDVREMFAVFRISYTRLQTLLQQHELPETRLKKYTNYILDLRKHAELLELYWGTLRPDFVYLDLETSGLSVDRGAVVLSIGLVTSQGKEFYSLVRPTMEQMEQSSESTMKSNGLTWEELKDAPDMDQVGSKLIRFCESQHIEYGKAVLVGQNPHFDRRFLQRYFHPWLIPRRVPLDALLDVRWLYRLLMNNELLPKLETCHGQDIAKALGVEVEPWPHQALQGAYQAQRNFQSMLRRTRLGNYIL